MINLTKNPFLKGVSCRECSDEDYDRWVAEKRKQLEKETNYVSGLVKALDKSKKNNFSEAASEIAGTYDVEGHDRESAEVGTHPTGCR